MRFEELVATSYIMESEKTHTASPVPPEEVFFLLCDFREGVPATDQVELLIVAVSQGVVTRQPVTLYQYKSLGLDPRITSSHCCHNTGPPTHTNT